MLVSLIVLWSCSLAVGDTHSDPRFYQMAERDMIERNDTMNKICVDHPQTSSCLASANKCMKGIPARTTLKNCDHQVFVKCLFKKRGAFPGRGQFVGESRRLCKKELGPKKCPRRGKNSRKNLIPYLTPQRYDEFRKKKGLPEELGVKAEMCLSKEFSSKRGLNMKQWMNNAKTGLDDVDYRDSLQTSIMGCEYSRKKSTDRKEYQDCIIEGCCYVMEQLVNMNIVQST